MRAIALDDRGAAFDEPLKNFRLGIGDGFDISEVFEMDSFDGRDDSGVRLNPLHEICDLACVVHTDFEHTILGIARHVGEGQRYAPVIVV